VAEVLSKAAEDSLFYCSNVICVLDTIGRDVEDGWSGSKGGKQVGGDAEAGLSLWQQPSMVR